MNLIIDFKKEYTPYFQAFIKAKGLKDGDACKSYEFINWIIGKHEEFKKNTGIPQYAPYTKEQEEKFLEFITGNIDLKM